MTLKRCTASQRMERGKNNSMKMEEKRVSPQHQAVIHKEGVNARPGGERRGLGEAVGTWWDNFS
jgi:hypothetical protein